MESFLQGFHKESFKDLFMVGLEVNFIKPALHIENPRQVVKGKIDHTTTTDSGW